LLNKVYEWIFASQGATMNDKPTRVISTQVTFICKKCGKEITDKKPRYEGWEQEGKTRMEDDAGVNAVVYCPNCGWHFEVIIL
jgi:predicted RNA-binding Zn-ribbon protein involved in translation (DUF1610 family)